jgi:hypothetical protein
MLSAESAKPLAVGIALSGAPSVFFDAAAIFAYPEPASANTSRQRSASACGLREARLAESDA